MGTEEGAPRACAGQGCPAHAAFAATGEITVNGERLRFVQVTAEQQQIIVRALGGTEVGTSNVQLPTSNIERGSEGAGHPPALGSGAVLGAEIVRWIAAGARIAGFVLAVGGTVLGVGHGPDHPLAHGGGEVTSAACGAVGEQDDTGKRRRDDDRKAQGGKREAEGGGQTPEDGDQRSEVRKNGGEATPHPGPLPDRGGEGDGARGATRPTEVGALTEIREMVAGIYREIAGVRQGIVELRTAKERLAQMQAEGWFAFTERIDPDSFRAVCAVMANGDIAKASRSLEIGDSTLRARIAGWGRRGPAYGRLLQLVRWRKAIGKREKVPLDERVLRGTAASTDFAGLLSDVLEELLEMNDENWQERVDALAELLRPVVAGSQQG